MFRGRVITADGHLVQRVTQRWVLRTLGLNMTCKYGVLMQGGIPLAHVQWSTLNSNMVISTLIPLNCAVLRIMQVVLHYGCCALKTYLEFCLIAQGLETTDFELRGTVLQREEQSMGCGK